MKMNWKDTEERMRSVGSCGIFYKLNPLKAIISNPDVPFSGLHNIPPFGPLLACMYNVCISSMVKRTKHYKSVPSFVAINYNADSNLLLILNAFTTVDTKKTILACCLHFWNLRTVNDQPFKVWEHAPDAWENSCWDYTRYPSLFLHAPLSIFLLSNGLPMTWNFMHHSNACLSKERRSVWINRITPNILRTKTKHDPQWMNMINCTWNIAHHLFHDTGLWRNNSCTTPMRVLSKERHSVWINRITPNILRPWGKLK